MNNFYSAKGWMLMKICATQSLIAVLFTGLSVAHSGSAQILDREITIEVTDESFAATLGQIAAQTNAYFAYSPDLLNVRDNITLKLERVSVRDVLDRLLRPRHISYSVHSDGTTIFLKRISGSDSLGSSESNLSVARKILITGTVRDDAAQPLAGVNILVKGTSSGTTSDSEGKYTINADAGQELVFSYIGYQTLIIAIGNASVVDVTLQDDTQTLNEVVVNVGYWEVREKEQTGSVARVTSEQISRQPVTNPLQAMQGRMTGVYIQQNTGMPGGGFSVQIRGQNSLRTGGTAGNGNLPLYIVDGVPFTSSSLTSGVISSGNLRGGNALASISPNDIESIEVLKDADATSVYGSRGANGVVLITTKRAATGKPSLTLDFSSGIGKVRRQMDLLSTRDYLTMRKEAIANDGYSDLVGDPSLDALWPDLTLWDSTRYTNWQKELIGGTASIVSTQATLSGGDAQTRYSVGGSFYRESTVFPGEHDFKRVTGRTTLNHTSRNKRFTVGSAVNFINSWTDIPSTDFATLAVTLAPNAPALRDSEGKLNWENSSWSNPLAAIEREYLNTITNLVTNISLSYELIDGLRIKADGGYTSMNVDEVRLSPLRAIDPAALKGRTGTSTFGDARLSTWIVEPQLSYVRTIGKGELTGLVGATFQQSVQQGKTIEATGYTNDGLLRNIDAAPALNVVESTYSQYRYAAAFARLNYLWNEKWILNLTGRRDGSSRFGPGRQFGTFGAIGTAWIFSREKWAEQVDFLSFGKIRTSYGTTGSDAINNYQYLDTYTTTPYPYGGSTGLTLSRLGNADYSWETNRKFEAALELGFFDDRISFTGAYYNNRSGNQLVGLPLPVMTGQSTVQFNLPAEVENTGLEFQLTTVNVRTDNFEWIMDINATFPRNTLVSFPDIENFPAYMRRYDVGQSVYSYKALVSTSVNPETGVYTFEDLNDNGSIGSEDIKIRERLTQRAYGGFNSSFRYKSVRLDFFFQFVKQTGLSYQPSFDIPGTQSNQPAEVMDRWQNTGDRSYIQKFSAFDPEGVVYAAYANALFSDQVIVDASFIRLKNISLSYELPKKWIAKAKMQSAKVYVQGQNLLTITNYIGLDPETQNAGNIPPLTVYTAGIQLKF